jgi:hypothetical protein
MNAIMGVARAGDMGVDVMQFNLHKTFSTPHGGGGPARARSRCARCSPTTCRPAAVGAGRRSCGRRTGPKSVGRVRSFYGNFGVLVRAYAYLTRLGGAGPREASRLAVLNANYVRRRSRRLSPRLRDALAARVRLLDRNLQATTSTRSTSRSACSTTASTPDHLLPARREGRADDRADGDGDRRRSTSSSPRCSQIAEEASASRRSSGTLRTRRASHASTRRAPRGAPCLAGVRPPRAPQSRPFR